MRVKLFHAEAERDWARRLTYRLVEAGHEVHTVESAPVPPAEVWLVIWSAAFEATPAARLLFEEADPPRLLMLRADDTRIPFALRRAPVVGDLRHWRGGMPDQDLNRLLRAIENDPSLSEVVLSAPHRPPAAGQLPVPVPPASAPTRRGGLLDLLGGLVGVFKRRAEPVGAGAGRAPADRSAPPEAAGAAPPDEPLTAAPPDALLPPEPAVTPVQVAASAPRRCVAGTPFVAALAAYTEAARDVALKHLAELGESDDRRVSDIDASHWRVGAPVVVRLAAAGARVEPAEQRFAWNGREKVAAFTVTVEGGDAVVLQFAVFVADVPVASLPLRVSVGGGAPAASEPPQQVQGRVARSAFASYSSKDAAIVTQRLSTLVRWSPGLDIFQDCLDLTPGENFKPQLAAQIAARDVFLLFWSRQAAASPWVRWEYGTAIERKGLEAILPMPLEDPAIAPPPPELAEQHLRDRFMMAGYALAKVQEERAR